MFLRQELFTLNKNRRNGGGRNLKFSRMPETCWLKFNTSRVQTRLKRLTFGRKSHAKACWHRAQQRQRSPLPLGSKRESHSYTMLFIRLPQNEPIPSNSSQKTPSIHPQVPPPPTGIREQTAAIHTVFSLGAKELTTGHRQNLTTCHPSDTALNPNKISRNL